MSKTFILSPSLTLILAVSLAGCTASQGTPLQAEPAMPGMDSALPAATATPGLVGQGLVVQYTALALQQTQANLQVRVAEATAQAQQTQDVRAALAADRAATGTAQAASLNMQETIGAATQADRETELAFNMTVGAATAAAESTSTAHKLTATAVTDAARHQASTGETISWATAIFCAVLAAIVLWYSIRIGRGLARRADPNHDPNSVRIIRTTVGPVLIIPLAGGGFTRELLSAPGLPAPVAALTDDMQFDTDEELPEEAAGAPVYANGHLTGFYNRAQAGKQMQADEANRKFLMDFLRKCIRVHGPASAVVPSHDRLGIATETWAKATDMLGPLIEKRRGRNGGTWLIGEHANLGDVWRAVGERRFVPRPAGRRTIVEHSPTPADPIAADD